MTAQPTRTDLSDRALELEGAVLAAKLRASRAILGWSQAELAARVGLTQKSVHQIERMMVEPKRRTVRAIEEWWRSVGISFDALPDGGFRIVVSSAVLQEPAVAREEAPVRPAQAIAAAHLV